MNKYKPVTSPLVSHFKLSHDSYPKDDKEKEEMRNVSYVLIVGSLMYAMVSMRSDIAHAVGVVSCFFFLIRIWCIGIPLSGYLDI
jgi:hypothetical protein